MGNWRVKEVITEPSNSSELIGCSKYEAEFKIHKDGSIGNWVCGKVMITQVL